MVKMRDTAEFVEILMVQLENMDWIFVEGASEKDMLYLVLKLLNKSSNLLI